jgi:hypothetical protein
MAEDLDRMLARLARAHVDVPLVGFEQRVLAGVAAQREARRTARALAPVRLAAVSLALAMGVTAGGMAAATTLAQPHGLDTFSGSSHLAPSTLLEGAG